MTDDTPAFLCLLNDEAYGKHMSRSTANSPTANSHRQQLAAIALFSSCSAKQLDKLAQLTERIDIVAGHVVVEQGARGEECYVIVTGSVSVQVNGELASILHSGEYFGELAPLDGQPRSATVTALTDCTLLVLGPKQFKTAVETSPTAACVFRCLLVKQVPSNWKRRIDYLSDEIKGAARSCLLRIHPDLEHYQDRPRDDSDGANNPQDRFDFGHGLSIGRGRKQVHDPLPRR